MGKTNRQPGRLFAALAADRVGLETKTIAAEVVVAEALAVAGVEAEVHEMGAGERFWVLRVRATPFLDCNRT